MGKQAEYLRALAWTLCHAWFLFSLSGIPPLAGFLGKCRIFRSLLDGVLAGRGHDRQQCGQHAYYYLHTVVTMDFQQRPQEVHALQSSPTMQVDMALAGIMGMATGVLPAFFMDLLTVPGL